jgi:hypothetical protein
MFHKQAAGQITSMKPIEEPKIEMKKQISKETATSRLKELNYLLEQKVAEEEALLKTK